MKKIIFLLLLVSIVSCEKEPSQIEKCIAVNSNKVYEDILAQERMNANKVFENSPVVIKSDLLIQFWEDWKPIGEEMKLAKEDFERMLDEGIITSSVFNKELSLISVLLFYPELDVVEMIEESVEGFSKNDLFFSEIPTLNELINNLKVYTLQIKLYEEFEIKTGESLEIPIKDYMTKLVLYNNEYYSESNGSIKNLTESNARKKADLKAIEVCNSQGIY
tara:strand:+ start:130 stop:789 length:660 start_codon:yes stop_codon:yes gene_type:complete